MIDIGTSIRKAYFDVLKSAIELNDSEIPVVDEKLDAQISEHDMYMLIGAQNETPIDNKTNYVNEVEITITVVNRRKSTNSKTAVEAIVSQMLALLFPTKNTNSLILSAPLNLTYARYTQGEYRFEKMDDGWKIMKPVTFKNRITQ